MHAYLQNNPVSFHPDPIRNDGAVRGLFWRGSLAPTRRTTRRTR